MIGPNLSGWECSMAMAGSGHTEPAQGVGPRGWGSAPFVVVAPS